MSALKEDKLVAPSPTSNSSTPGGLDIPEARDGFFGYTEEKSLKQVFEIIVTSELNYISDSLPTQIEEKYWAHRRGSDTHSEAGSFKPLSLQGTAIGDTFYEEQEDNQHNQLTGVVHATGAYHLRCCQPISAYCYPRTYYQRRADPTSPIISKMPRITGQIYA